MGLGHFPNKIARVYKHEHCLPEWQAPVWVLTGFACYSARKSRSYRPGFQKMLAEIEAGHVEVVITKDLSRLGRNSSQTGLYINYTFPQYGVRYIAINDHFVTIDPNSTDSDMAGIKNWFNVWYSKDTSRKIRAVVLKQIVWKHIQEVISVVTRYEAHFRSEMEKGSVCRARNHCGCIRSGWHRPRSESESLTVFSSAFTRTMLPVGWMMNASP